MLTPLFRKEGKCIKENKKAETINIIYSVFLLFTFLNNLLHINPLKTLSSTNATKQNCVIIV